MTVVSANRLEILQIADAVAREKGIDRFIVIEAMEDAMQKAARARYGAEHDIRVTIDPKTGDTRMVRCLTVVEDVVQDAVEIDLVSARRRKPDVQPGFVFEEELPPLEYGRVGAQTAKQVILQKVRDAERDRQFEDFKDRVGDIINGVVKRVEYGNTIVDIGRGEGVILKSQAIPRETFQSGDRVRAFLYDVRREPKGHQVFLSRAHPQFMAKLFAQEVPEVNSGTIEIKSVARDPGSRAKIAVVSYDGSIDPVGACVGMRGARVQAVVAELHGERVDIIPWSQDEAAFLVNALQPAEVSKVVIDSDEGRVEVVVPAEQLSLGIGRRGQNVRLASMLTGWQIDILTEEQDSERRQKEFETRTKLFVSVLQIDETLAQLLASEGFASIEDVAYTDADELASIPGIGPDNGAELQSRANDHLARETRKLDEERLSLGVADEVLDIAGITLARAITLGKAGVRTTDDLAGLTPDDLVGWIDLVKGQKIPHKGVFDQKDLSREAAEALILHARVAAGWIKAPEPEYPDDGEEGYYDDAGGDQAGGEYAEDGLVFDEDEAREAGIVADDSVSGPSGGEDESRP